ncbi:septum site-determining protein Ssd [Georgenia muralis]
MGSSGTLQVVLRTGDEAVAAQVGRLTDLAGVALLVVPPDRVLPAAPVVLDHERTDLPVLRVHVDPGRVGFVPGSPEVLPTLVELPGDAPVLLDVVVAAGTPHRARTVGVVAAHGGAGASVLAAALARAAVDDGAATALADLDPAGGGLDVLLGLEHDPGRRWADLRAERGALLPERLALALPSWHLVRVLSGDHRGGVDLADLVARSAVRALGQGHDLVVLDLPRQVLAGGEAARTWLGWCGDVVLVAGGGVRGAAAARAGAAALGASGSRGHLVVRAGAVECEEVADHAGLGRAVRLREQRGLAAGVEHGLAPGDQRRGPLRAAASAVLRDLGSWP